MNKHSLSGLCGGVSIRNLADQNIFRDNKRGVESIHCHELNGCEVSPDIQVALPALHLPILSILFIIDKAPLTHSTNTILVLENS